MNVAIIPARGGSKRIPKKNIKHFHGKPMIAYSIEAAKKANIFSDIIVSTDSEEIAQIAKDYGASVPFMRPSELSDDFSGTGVVIEHALNTLKVAGKEYDYCCTLYATAPFIEASNLKQSFNQLKNSDAKYCFSAAKFDYPIWRSFSINKDNRCKMFFPEFFNSRSQDLEEAYHDAGQFYWNDLRVSSNKTIFDTDSIPFVLPKYKVQDIDTLEDWSKAELMYDAFSKNFKESKT